MSRAAVEADIRETLGLVPSFFAEVPDTLIGSEWESFKAFEKLSETAIPNKYKELIGLAVSGATRCRYCAFFHAETARLFGATDEEIAGPPSWPSTRWAGAPTSTRCSWTRRPSGRVRADRRLRALAGRGPRARLTRRCACTNAGERRHARRHLPGALGADRGGAWPVADARRPAGPRRGPGRCSSASSPTTTPASPAPTTEGSPVRLRSSTSAWPTCTRRLPRGMRRDGAGVRGAPGPAGQGLAAPADGTYGGVYLFRDSESMSYLASELFATVAAFPHFTDIVARDFGVYEDLTPGHGARADGRRAGGRVEADGTRPRAAVIAAPRAGRQEDGRPLSVRGGASSCRTEGSAGEDPSHERLGAGGAVGAPTLGRGARNARAWAILSRSNSLARRRFISGWRIRVLSRDSPAAASLPAGAHPGHLPHACVAHLGYSTLETSSSTCGGLDPVCVRDGARKLGLAEPLEGLRRGPEIDASVLAGLGKPQVVLLHEPWDRQVLRSPRFHRREKTSSSVRRDL